MYDVLGCALHVLAKPYNVVINVLNCDKISLSEDIDKNVHTQISLVLLHSTIH